jgi:MFS family permease
MSRRAPSPPSWRRIVLSGVGGALTLTALVAIAILLFGRFGDTEGRILGTTLFLALFGLLALPAGILLDQKRRPALAAAVVALSVAGFGLATAGIWNEDGPVALTKLTGTVVAFAVATTQVAALAARRRAGDTTIVRSLYVASTAIGLTLASVAAFALWAEVESQLFVRGLAAAVVLDVLLVALQPVVAAMQAPGRLYTFRVRLEPAATVEVTIDAPRLSRAAARAIESAEGAGRRVVAVEVLEPTRHTTAENEHPAGRPAPSV